MVRNIEKEVTVTEKRAIGKQIYCDACEKLIFDTQDIDTYHDPHRHPTQYWEVTTGHYDWGNDSCDSVETRQYCSKECLTKAFDQYLKRTEDMINSEYFEIHNRQI